MLPLNNNSLLIPPPTKPIIYNCQTSRFEFKRRIKICYAGSIYKVNGIIELLKATNALHNIELHLYGQIDSNFQNEFRSFLTINSKYHGVLNQDELINSMLDCDILIEPRDNNPIFTEFSYPSKINFYLSFSKPIISTDLIGLPIDVKDLLFIIPSNSPENITEGINRVLNLKYDYLENKMESIRHYTSKNLDYRVLSSKIYSFIKSFNSE
jgi:glycosyltransferase involved in cell wall biosynthesis